MPLSMIHYWFIVPPPDREKDAQRGTERYWGCENEGNAKRKWKILLMFLSCLFAAVVVTQSSAELSCLLKDHTERESTNKTGEKESFVLGWKQNCLESQTMSRDSQVSSTHRSQFPRSFVNVCNADELLSVWAETLGSALPSPRQHIDSSGNQIRCTSLS